VAFRFLRLDKARMKSVLLKLSLLGSALFSGVLPSVVSSQPSTRPFVPVFNTDFPDPFVLKDGDRYLAYATNAQGDRANIQMAQSTDLVDWTLIMDGQKLHDAMPVLPPWAKQGFTWAPEVIQTRDGFVLHFTARDKVSDLQCLGAAFSTSPMGPFVSNAPTPLVCQTTMGGTIDSHAFSDDDGSLYLYYKNDGNNPLSRTPTDIFVQRLTPDALSVVGPATPLLRNGAAWEAHVIEAPTMVRRGDNYFLFYSANHFGWEPHQRLSPYSIGYAVCDGPMGPCRKAPENPILNSYNTRKLGCLSGPGHQSIVVSQGRMFISFHAWAANSGCRKVGNQRYLYVAPLLWRDGKPVIGQSLRAVTPPSAAR
jgi:beta-xylosidase